MAVLTSVYTRLSLIMWYMHLMLAPILLFCQVEERGKKKKKLDRMGYVCFMPFCTQADEITIHQSGHRLYLFHCTSSLAFIWEQQAMSRFNLPVMLLKLHLCLGFFFCSSNGSHTENQLRLLFKAGESAESGWDTHNLLSTASHSSFYLTSRPRTSFLPRPCFWPAVERV